ncbi:MAG: hypothetical protein Q7T61_10965 [Caulobacter sp.]|nr:hypothetical protein [Caulobacter sp.]
MAYAVTPAAQPITGELSPAEGKAPPVIDSHGGKLNPITCFCGGPDSAVSFLMILALLATLAPRRLNAFNRETDLSVLRLAPGLLLTTLLVLNDLLSTGPVRDLPARFHLVAPVVAAVGGALLAISFLRLLSEALMPIAGRSPAMSVAAMATSGLAVLALPLVASVQVYRLMDDGRLTFAWKPVVGGYLGIPAGLAVLLAWRRFDGRLFGVLLLVGTAGLIILGGILLSGAETSVFVFLTVTFTVADRVAAGLRGMGRANWQGLTGRMAWILSWVLLILSVMTVGMWAIFIG